MGPLRIFPFLLLFLPIPIVFLFVSSRITSFRDLDSMLQDPVKSSDDVAGSGKSQHSTSWATESTVQTSAARGPDIAYLRGVLKGRINNFALTQQQQQQTQLVVSKTSGPTRLSTSTATDTSTLAKTLSTTLSKTTPAETTPEETTPQEASLTTLQDDTAVRSGSEAAPPQHAATESLVSTLVEGDVTRDTRTSPTEALRRMTWATDDPNKLLYVLETPAITIGPNYILREHLECFDRYRNTSVSLSLCFTAVTRTSDTLPSPLKRDPQRLPNVTDNGPKAEYAHFVLWERAKLPQKNATLAEGTMDLTFDSELRYTLSTFFALTCELLDFLQIEWIVSSGTVIGALRHLDQIPWDDDCDVSVPLHQIGWLYGFFHHGAMNEDKAPEGLQRVGARWWEWYVKTVPADLRREAEERYLSKLGLAMSSHRRTGGSFTGKIYWKSGKKVHSHPWRHPFVDVFSYELRASSDKDNSTLDRFFLLANAVSQPLSWAFPVLYRPLGRTPVRMARLTPEINVAFIDNLRFMTECYTGLYSHYYEMTKPSSECPCFALHDRIPFITERQFIYIDAHVFPDAPSRAPPSSSFIAALVEQQKAFHVLEKEDSKTVNPVAGVHSLHPVWNKSILRRNDALDFDHLRQHHTVATLDNQQSETRYDEGLFEVLSVHGVPIAELILLAPHGFYKQLTPAQFFSGASFAG